MVPSSARAGRPRLTTRTYPRLSPSTCACSRIFCTTRGQLPSLSPLGIAYSVVVAVLSPCFDFNVGVCSRNRFGLNTLQMSSRRETNRSAGHQPRGAMHTAHICDTEYPQQPLLRWLRRWTSGLGRHRALFCGWHSDCLFPKFPLYLSP